MQLRVNLVTLGVADLAAARRFYEDGLGWRPRFVADDVAFYQAGTVVVSLFLRGALAADANLPGPGAPGFRGVALAHNVATREEVDALLAEAQAAGATILKPAKDAEWGGYSGYFADPDGHAWEIAWNPHWPLDEEGVVQLPE